ncbi:MULTISPECIES: toll/interleukin-1 receptor domain-containing protein [unclassified Rhodococcus (in: high G+C Gram-positive bacteria)]|uniref:toll/interleukin-1 receptor domain-containing protein n=1 Tax=unclassified Rhodococcus (in: high G+C Gram-positive bacteria) TaxID=192944 RepID=UPI000B9AE612|nr:MULTISPECIES: toll/interleukin-1 receptor domain-containing protein [unclassified Rhodococcus (in: high G+C Gram-positive bacteria)]OZE31539.1 hypothetical protein CH259_25770 [Rhodococcus sp. 05-2254-4]OZE42469.1 hypothetical protein CH261_20255 [Rhodococcus sp. 05-2254-3]OZE46625.1 hypothetical protein CH283_19920 [Rhodococcus sp. 05-2254-2]
MTDADKAPALPLDDTPDEDDPFELDGFWSYVHKDDDAEGGRIAGLCRKVMAEYELRTGTALNLFLDRDSLDWGDKWRQAIDGALNETTFFIAVVTPKFLKSKECRKELNLFANNAKARGIPELLLPIQYVATPGLELGAKDEVARAIAQAQYLDFSDLRLLEESGPEYRAMISKIVDRLLKIAKSVASKPEIPSIADDGPPDEDDDQGGVSKDPDDHVGPQPSGQHNDPDFDLDDDDAPGLLEYIAETETLMPAWQQTLEELSKRMNEITAITDEHSPTMKIAAAKGAKAQIVAAANYANSLMPAAQAFEDTGNLYANQAVGMNTTILPILAQLSHQSYEKREENSANTFMNSVVEIARNGRRSAVSVEDFQKTVRNVSSMSRAIRKPLKMIIRGSQSFLDGQQLYDDWERRIQKIMQDDPPNSFEAEQSDFTLQ